MASKETVQTRRPRIALKACAALGLTLLVGMPAVASANPDSAGPNPLASHPRSPVTARRLASDYHNVKRGSKLPTGWVGSRSFANSTNGFGLATIGGKAGGGTYPAYTSDGGATWHTNGPLFFNATADAAEAVEFTGVVGDRIEYAYGAGVVDVTTNAGRTWWQAFLGEQVLAVTHQNGRLIAFVQEQVNHQGPKAVTQVCVSRDGGRRWRFTNKLGAD